MAMIGINVSKKKPDCLWLKVPDVSGLWECPPSAILAETDAGKTRCWLKISIGRQAGVMNDDYAERGSG
ncbi:MAG: hypothetical protein ACE5GZ_06560 [Gammaproteobacteria bacterium]